MVYTNLDELPIVLNVGQISDILHISKNNAYLLVRSEAFPKIVVGKRIVVFKEAFINWLRESKVVNIS